METNYKHFQQITDRLVSYLRVRENKQKSGEDELWKKIEKEISRKKQMSLKHRLSIFSTAAAVLFLLFFSVNYFWFQDSGSLDKYVQQLGEPVLESTQIQVFLSPQNKVIVDEKSASVTYSSQGNVSINEKKQQVETPEKVEPEYNQIVVPKGKYTHLTLSDGSTVHINSGTRVVYPRVFSGDHREIYVEGEVCLHVTKNEKTPFIVKTSSFEVEVLGTVFNVNAYKEESRNEVVLVEGRVRLSDNRKNKVELKPNQLIDIENGRTGSLKEVNASDYIAWTEGLLILQLEPLSNVLKKLERFYGVSISVSPEAGQLKMNGKVDLKQSFDDLIKLISTTAPIICDKIDGIYYIQEKER